MITKTNQTTALFTRQDIITLTDTTKTFRESDIVIVIVFHERIPSTVVMIGIQVVIVCIVYASLRGDCLGFEHDTTEAQEASNNVRFPNPFVPESVFSGKSLLHMINEYRGVFDALGADIGQVDPVIAAELGDTDDFDEIEDENEEVTNLLAAPKISDECMFDYNLTMEAYNRSDIWALTSRSFNCVLNSML